MRGHSAPTGLCRPHPLRWCAAMSADQPVTVGFARSPLGPYGPCVPFQCPYHTLDTPATLGPPPTYLPSIGARGQRTQGGEGGRVAMVNHSSARSSPETPFGPRRSRSPLGSSQDDANAYHCGSVLRSIAKYSLTAASYSARSAWLICLYPCSLTIKPVFSKA
jgi:hypothetical protein